MDSRTCSVLFATVVIFQLIYVNQVRAIRCFQCNSVNDTACPFLSRSDVNSPYLQDCPPMMHGRDVFCRTILQEIKSHDNMLRVTRSCGWFQGHRKCYKSSNEDHDEEVCQCFEDGCNASKAGLVTFNWWSMGISILIGGTYLIRL